MYRIAICDDSSSYIEYLKDVLMELEREYSMDFVIYEYYSGESLIDSLNEDMNYDLLILDMQLGEMDGDETAQQFRLKNKDAVLVFCSGVQLPTIESFKATPFRYILKQQKYQEIKHVLKETLEEVKRTIKDPFIISHYRQHVKKVYLSQVLYIKGVKRGSQIILSENAEDKREDEKLLSDKKPEDLLSELEEHGFALAQRSYLVNLNRIEMLRVGDLVFDTGEILKIARAYQKSFREAFVKRFSNKYS